MKISMEVEEEEKRNKIKGGRIDSCRKRGGMTDRARTEEE
jgi:hypothetical protein